MSLKPQIIQTDSRGRIQLPKPFKDHRLYELVAQGTHLSLYPLKTERVIGTRASESSPFTQAELKLFLDKQFFPKLVAEARNERRVTCHALILYGSYARGTALNTSDFDIAFFCDRFPSFKERSAIHQSFEEAIRLEQESLEVRRVVSPLSLLFIPLTDASLNSSLVSTIFKEGRVLWKDVRWKSWSGRLSSQSRRKVEKK